jgi:DNA-binding CsgD family transcriptional regulator
MQDWSVESAASAQVSTRLARLAIATVGSSQFANKLLIGVNSQLLAASYCSLFWINRNAGVRVVDVAGRDTSSPGTASAHTYVESKFYGHDPLFTDIVGLGTGSLLRLHRSSEICVDAYRSACYEVLGLHQRCSLVFPWQDDSWLALNFYRHYRDDTFSSCELVGLREAGELLGVTVRRHMKITQKPEATLSRVRRLFAQADLTSREEQVLTQALNGLSNKQIARQLGIEPSTVITYRERAYRRLGLRRHAELVRLIVNQ